MYSSSSDGGPPWPPDGSDGSSSSGSSSSSSGSSAENPFGSLFIDLIDIGGIPSFPDWWRLVFDNRPEEANQDGSVATCDYIFELTPPSGVAHRYEVRLDLAFEAAVIITQADLHVYANDTAPTLTYPGLRVEVSYFGDVQAQELNPVLTKSTPPADGLVTPITVFADGTFTMV